MPEMMGPRRSQKPSLMTGALRRFVLAQQPNAPDVAQVRTERLRAIVKNATEHVPLYRELYRAHKIDIAGIATPNDLWRLPAVSKVDYVRGGPQSYVNERALPNLRDLHMQSTSGSLGASLKIYSTQDEATLQLAGLWAGWVGAGVVPNDRLFMMSAPYLAQKIPPFQSVFIPVQKPMNEALDQFSTFEPTVVIGMVEAIALLARELRERDLPQRKNVRAVFSFGQTYSAQLRGMIDNGFDAPVSILYGAAETGWLGYQCAQHNGFHIPEGRVVVQIARTGRPNEPADDGETGEVIITSLLRATTPFIRYRLHDAAAIDPTPCACGRKSARIVNLEGRIQDFLVARDGHWVGPGAVAIDLFVGHPHIVDHRIVQETPDQVRVSLVIAGELPPNEHERVRQVIQRHLGEVKIDIDIVEEIPREPSGKRRRVFRMFDLPA